MNAVDGNRKLYATFRYENPEWSGLGNPWEGTVYTTCTIYDDRNRMITAAGAKKSPRDQFFRAKGREIALGRALYNIYPHNAVKRHELLSQFIASSHMQVPQGKLAKKSTPRPPVPHLHEAISGGYIEDWPIPLPTAIFGVTVISVVLAVVIRLIFGG